MFEKAKAFLSGWEFPTAVQAEDLRVVPAESIPGLGGRVLRFIHASQPGEPHRVIDAGNGATVYVELCIVVRLRADGSFEQELLLLHLVEDQEPRLRLQSEKWKGRINDDLLERMETASQKLAAAFQALAKKMRDTVATYEADREVERGDLTIDSLSLGMPGPAKPEPQVKHRVEKKREQRRQQMQHARSLRHNGK